MLLQCLQMKLKWNLSNVSETTGSEMDKIDNQLQDYLSVTDYLSCWLKDLLIILNEITIKCLTVSRIVQET